MVAATVESPELDTVLFITVLAPDGDNPADALHKRKPVKIISAATALRDRICDFISLLS
jgi:hypothetical protein